jgi:hypothetical protein
MKHHIAIILAPAAALLLGSCVVEVPSNSQGAATQLPDKIPASGQPLTAVTGQGSVIIREGSRTLTSFRTARPNIEETRWYQGQQQIVVKSRGNHGPATVELFESRTGRKLGTVMAYELANGGPAWAKGMAE